MADFSVFDASVELGDEPIGASTPLVFSTTSSASGLKRCRALSSDLIRHSFHNRGVHDIVRERSPRLAQMAVQSSPSLRTETAFLRTLLKLPNA
ncbi:hypothetical protein GJ744_008908 [Endocarpon pusillum]|uniref:Uncharacterized protein n=1 Tax=Endocarpon pusillum TaxID=364733 RepID=A0A8H7ASM0_9EURO|nr:hypothetical protein GJ744_008908 [Endocarpon pusillum]